MKNENKLTNGRPPLGELKRSKAIKLTFTELEYSQIVKLAVDNDMPVNELLRKLSIGGSVIVKEKFSNEEKDILRSLYQVGNNLNQLTKRLNERQSPMENEFKEVIKQFHVIYQKLSR